MSHSATELNMSPQSRIWIYQANRPLPAENVEEIREQIRSFTGRWVSHNQQLKAFGDLLHRRFLILLVDESQAGASGCSIDASVAFVKALQAEQGVDFFDRLRFSYQDDKGTVHTVSRDEFAARYQSGKISDDTLVFDTLVKTKADFDGSFLKPLKDSWHARMV